MSLKDRILREMVVDTSKGSPWNLALEIFNELPSELKTPESLDEIQSKLQNIGDKAQ